MNFIRKLIKINGELSHMLKQYKILRFNYVIYLLEVEVLFQNCRYDKNIRRKLRVIIWKQLAYKRVLEKAISKERLNKRGLVNRLLFISSYYYKLNLHIPNGTYGGVKRKKYMD